MNCCREVFCGPSVILTALLPLVTVSAGCVRSPQTVREMTLGRSPENPPEGDSTASESENAPGQSAGAIVTDLPDEAPYAPHAPAAVRQASYTSELAEPSVDAASSSIDPVPSEPLGNVVHVDTDSFPRQVLQSDVPVLVDFYADWCGPCRVLAPTLNQLARQTRNAKVVKVNIDDSPQIASKYGVKSVPTIMVFKSGSVVAKHTGLADRAALQRLLSR